ncbi:hypothetical protein ACFYY2_31345 [Streptomyces sp. NPDC001822]|uniref:hypothetical protein n=1 Tax=Streptomyces sp. NPDC001822 TaxID=3364614 RepID=UPI0036AD84B1
MGDVVMRTGRQDRPDLRKRNHLTVAALLLATCGLSAVVGCSADPATDAKPAKATPAAPSGQPAPSADPTEAAETAAIGVYKQYWQEMELGYAKGSSKGTSLQDYAAGLALIKANDGMASMVSADQLAVGQVTVDSPTATESDINRKTPNVKLASCLDVSKWQVIDSKTRKPVPLPSTRLTRYVVHSVIEKWPEGWRVVKDEPQEKAC